MKGNFSIKIFKTDTGHTSLTDVFRLYYNATFVYGNRNMKLISASAEKDMLVLIDEKQSIITAQSSHCRVKLKDVTYIERDHLVSAIMAITNGKADFRNGGTASKDGKILNCKVGEYEISFDSTMNFSIRMKYESVEVLPKNLPHLIHFLIINNYDVFGLTSSNHAIKSI